MRTKKTIVKIFKATFGKDDQECYMVFKGRSILPEIDSEKYLFDYYLNSVVDNYIHLCWLERKGE